MNSETKICQNCKKEFTIEPEDFAFYQKIKVPPPTRCPECRLQRRLFFRNEGILYKRKSDYDGETIFSMFAQSSPIKVWPRQVWISDVWDPMTHGMNYDFNRSFFDQLKDLILTVPFPNLSVDNMIDSDYCNNFNDAKNCYMVFGGGFSENCMYSRRVTFSKECIDVSYTNKSELCFESFNLNHCYNTFFSIDCEDSNDIYFSKNLRGCSHCFGCVDLRSKNYHFFNQPLTKKEYLKKLEDFNIGSNIVMSSFLQKAWQFWLSFPNKYYHGRQNNNFSGEYIFNSKNVFNSYNIKGGEDLRYCQHADQPLTKDCYDYSYFGKNAELLYECAVCGLEARDLKFCLEDYIGVDDLQYSIHCRSSSHIFGCVGLRNKSYCILNKQYTKESFGKLRTRIIQHMNEMPYLDKKGRVYKYGEFFPIELSPFGYNETVAQEYFPLTKEEAIKQGFKWKDPEERNIKIQIPNDKLPDYIKDVPDDIVGQIIECGHQGTCNEQCTTAFKIIKEELQFYRRTNLPLPRLCPNCRHYQRLKQRNPLKLWHRKCMCHGTQSENGVYKNTIKHFHGSNPCPNEFETTYAPDRPEIVYCEKCYLAEVV